jgi:dsRNA-specific ribonuclease
MKDVFHVQVQVANNNNNNNNMNEYRTREYSYGIRGPPFCEFIRSLLLRSGLKTRYIDLLTNEESMKTYTDVFTHISIDPDRNYEYLEILGDVTCNKSIVWYIKDRFPQLQNSEGVKVIARLRINLVSKKNFASIADKLGFEPFISCEKEIKEQKGKSLLEDVFEAFFGATELLIDKIIGNGAGYGICYRILQSILDEESISLRYEDLYDPITRLKETFDFFRQQVPGRQCSMIWGNMLWENYKSDKGQVVSLFQYDKLTNRKRLLITTEAPLLDEAKQQAAGRYLQILNDQGFKRPIPAYYARIGLTEPAHASA